MGSEMRTCITDMLEHFGIYMLYIESEWGVGE